jgi:hypothetical protein
LTNDKIREAIDKGFGKVKFGEPNYKFLEELKNSGAAFSARKTQHQIRALNNALFDEKGNLKNWSQFKQDAAGIVKNYNQTWLRSEYDIAVRRARIASIWRDADDTELYTNMRWTPSLTSPENRRPEHIPFYNKVFRRDDAVWASGPGTLWGCKCGIEPTDDEPDGQSGKLPKAKPDPGIDSNPGETGKIFTQTHPYFKGLTKKEIKAAAVLEKNNTFTTIVGDGGYPVHISHGQTPQEVKANTL